MLLAAAVATAGDVAGLVVKLARQDIAVVTRRARGCSPVLGLRAVTNAPVAINLSDGAGDAVVHPAAATETCLWLGHRSKRYSQISVGLAAQVETQ